jgi:lysophospholipase L1-like esterase
VNASVAAPPDRPPMTFRRRLAILTILFLVASMAILGVLEGGARLMGARPGRRRVFDAERGWIYAPNTVFQYFTTQGRIHASVDGEGFRPTLAGADTPGAPAIVCLGDSYTFCGESPDDGTWPEFMSRELARKGLPCRAVNRGCTGYSSMQSLVALRRELSRSGGPSPVGGVLYLFCLNDPLENFVADRPHLSRDELAGAPGSSGSWDPKEYPPDDPPPRSLRVLLRDLRAPSAFVTSLRAEAPDDSPAAFMAGAATYADLYGPRCREFLDTPVFQEGIRQVLRKLRKECASRGAPLFVSTCIAPAWDTPGVARQEFAAMLNWSAERMEAQVADYHAALDRVRQLAAEEGATFIDVRGCLDGMKYREYAAASNDWHFSTEANERIGKALADRLFPHLARSAAAPP